MTVVDDLSTGRRENLTAALAGGAELIEADVRDREAMTELASDRKPEHVFHLAAQIDVRRSVADPAFDADINVGGTANMLEAARSADSSRATGGHSVSVAASIQASTVLSRSDLAVSGSEKGIGHAPVESARL